jgi:hypothetical protein
MKAGVKAGCITPNGYQSIRIDGVMYMAHRIAWKMFHGSEPPEQIDHVDRNNLNNAAVNLRPATYSQNNANHPIECRNKSGCTGVVWHESAHKWQAQLRLKGKTKYLGLFVNLDDAVAARVKAAAELFGEFSPHRRAA